MIYERNCYRNILKDEYELRASQNPLYSLRAFARDLKLSPASLSEILKGKQGLSIEKAKKITHTLQMNKNESDYFCDLVENKHARSKIKRDQARIRLSKYKTHQYTDLQIDMMKIITEWYHMAILELTYLKNFKGDIDWIAKTLRITNLEVQSAVERLIKLGLLEIKNNKWRDVETNLATTDGIPSKNIQRMQKQILDKAKQAIDEQSIEQRDITSIIMAIDTGDIPEVKKRIKEFRRSICEYLNKSKNKNAVYCLGSQFFGLDEHRQLKGDLS